ncbi:MAG: hypothetical protein HY904_23490 [Deltaproteobacteria bacterium]|nr:hypothetical protein [Deltaproteobacteria bacterium]
MVRMSRVGLVAVVGVALACSPGGGGGSSGGGTSSGGGSNDVGDFYLSELVPLICAFEERCAATRGRNYADAAACEDYYATLDAMYSVMLGKSFKQMLNEALTLDAAHASACKASFATAACTSDPFNDNADCELAAHPTQPIAAGGDCTTAGGDFSPRACDTGLRCNSRTDKPDCRTCVAPKADGQPCTSGSDCQSYECGPSSTCVAADPPAGLNASCESSFCAGNLDCAGAFGSSTCKAPAAENQPCGGDNADCRADLHCDGATHTCKALAADGAACDVMTTACRHLCKLTSATSTAGTCAPFSAAPGEGQPCAALGATEPSLACAAGLRAEFNTSGGSFSCTCRARLANGSACQSRAECQSDICLRNDVCGAAQADGQPCDRDSQCTSEWCDSNTSGGTCATPMCS